ncbi:MAG: DUF2807 domain-containing protein [Ignavibacteriales bacterium]|nr:DUF2807 domain-containing protein [Ignavibacteriales bacterium]
MKTKVIAGLLIFGLVVAGCSFWGVRGNGRVKHTSRSVGDFKRIDVGGAFTVNIKVGASPSVKIQAEENLIPLIKTTVRGDKLIIDTKKNISPRKEIVINVTTNYLESIECSGANDINASGISSDNFNVELSGAGSVDLQGDAKVVHAELSGAGNINAENLKASRVYISVSGAASARVYARDYLDASVSGVGSIDYYGDPQDVSTNVSGVGSITRK